jgi:hypothetical protein
MSELPCGDAIDQVIDRRKSQMRAKRKLEPLIWIA